MSVQKRSKKTIGAKSPLKKRKRIKSSKKGDEDVHTAEFLDIQTIREGMLLLGCIIEIRSDRLLMSLPGCLVGIVPITNISGKFTEMLKDSVEEEKSEITRLKSLFELGSNFPCKVLQVIRENLMKPTIILSIDPQVVNSDLKLQLLYTKMILYAAVVSIEDHGYVMDIGIRGFQGFLPFTAAIGDKLLCVGQVLPTYIKNLPSQKNMGHAISLASLGFEDTFPEISCEDIKRSAILPGVRVSAYVAEVREPFLYMKCSNYEACASTLSSYPSSKKFTEGTMVTGTVLYIHPITQCIYLHLRSLPNPKTFEDFFNLKKYDRIKNVKFHATYHSKLFFKCKKSIGYVKSINVIGKTTLTHDALMKNPVVPKARVVFLHYIDNLIQLTFVEDFLNMKITKFEEVKIGDIFEVIVKKHVEDGVFVSVCPGLSGFIRHAFLTDSFITMPEKIYPVGAKLNCRVLFKHPSLGLSLTSKESLVSLPNSELLQSYQDAVKGRYFKGVIVKNTDEYMLISFFNNVQGIVLSRDIPKLSIHLEGQTVLCAVMSCDPAKKKLKLSLDFQNHGSKNFQKSNSAEKGISINAEDKSKDVFSSKEISVKDLIAHSFAIQMKPLESKFEFVQGKPYKAFIMKITAHQLNVLVNGKEKGRVHITQLGCSVEGTLPLGEFAVGQRIKVYIVKEIERKSRNYLQISHQNVSCFLECSLTYPPSIPIDKDISIKDHVIGFIKELYDVSALVWITPYHTGTLEYIDVAEKPKDLRKLKRNLKVGQSLLASILSDNLSLKNVNGKIKLSKPGISVPDVGYNVAGLVTVASPDRELIIKLPQGYTGFVHLTDVQDVYSDLSPLLEKYLKLKFILCHVLEADHGKKTCVLSLRKSRLYNKVKCDENITPELTAEMIHQGQRVKGYIKFVSNTCIVVNIGRCLEGEVTLHKCSTYGCAICLNISTLLKASSIGNVIEVIIDSTSAANNFIPLSLPNISSMSYSQDISLNVIDDISWEDLE